MPGPRSMRLVESALRCYPRRWRSRHGDEAAEIATLLIRDGTPAHSVAWSYLMGAARTRLVIEPRRRLGAAAAALLLAAGSLGVPLALLSSPAPANAASVVHSRTPIAPPIRAPPIRGTAAHGPPIRGIGEGAARRTAVTGMTTADFGAPPMTWAGLPGARRAGRLRAQGAAVAAPRLRRMGHLPGAGAAAGVRHPDVRVPGLLDPHTSMVPALDVYDRILVQKAFFNWHQVREGDIVVFTHPPRDHCPGRPGRPRQARHCAAGRDDLLGRRHPLHRRQAAPRAVPAAT